MTLTIVPPEPDDTPTMPEVMPTGDRRALELIIRTLRREIEELTIAMRHMQTGMLTRAEWKAIEAEQKDRAQIFYGTRMLPTERRVLWSFVLATIACAFALAVLILKR